MRKDIKVFPHNPIWIKNFNQESENIKNTLGDVCINVHHIGSSSVPGLDSKDDIDICCVVKDLRKTLTLEQIGYVFKGELNIPLRYFFNKKTDALKVNLHVIEEGHPFLKLNLLFCEHMKKNETDRLAYGNLKHEILKNPHACEKIGTHFTHYTLAKYDFISHILEKIGYDDVRIMFCLHPTEWLAAQTLCDDPSIFEKNKETHIVFYKGIKIVGYAFVDILNEKPIQKVALLQDYKDLQLSFEEQLEKWICFKKTEFSNF